MNTDEGRPDALAQWMDELPWLAKVGWPNIYPWQIEKPRAYIKDILRWCKSFRCLELPYEEPSKGLEIPQFNYCLVRSTVLRGPRTGMYQTQVFVSRANNFMLMFNFTCTSGSPRLIFNSGCTAYVDGEHQLICCRIPVLSLFPFWRPTTQVDITILLPSYPVVAIRVSLQLPAISGTLLWHQL